MKNIGLLTVFALVAIGFTGLGALPQETAIGDSPTEAYKRLYAAVKSRDTAAITAQMSQKSIEFGAKAASRNHTPIKKVYENGFTATTFAPELPPIRDERIKDDMGAVEVWNAKEEKWEDLPFIVEDSMFKLAIGELFEGTYRSPAPGRGALEQEAADQNVNDEAIKPATSKSTKRKADVSGLGSPTSPPAARTPDYKIDKIKIVPFDEASGKFEDELMGTSDRAFFNDLSLSLFVTIEVAGEAGSFSAGRKLQITVTEGKKVKFSRTEQIGLIGSEGKYYVPVWLYSSMCSNVKISARITGQRIISTKTRTVAFDCGE